MKPRLLPLMISAALLPSAALAQDQREDTAAPTPRQMDTVQVTGSLIPRAQVEGPSPITSITAEDMEKQGFTNVFDALRSLPQSNGSVQDSQFTGGYTPGAKTVSLFGLDPSYTLTLLNGRPMSSYPLAYNGSTSIVDIANIPMGMIERIDVLTGGQSSVYGSAAIAGVVNIILKDHVEGMHLRYRVGGYEDGGGASQRFQFSGGTAFGNLNLSYALELSKQKPIYAYQRDEVDSVEDNPTGQGIYPSRSFLRQVTNTGATAYVDPGQATCDPLNYMFGGSNRYSLRDVSGGGYYCGSPRNVGAASLMSESEAVNGSVFLRYDITPETEFYTDLLVSYSKPTYTGGLPSWNQTFYNQDAGRFELWQRIFSPEEVGLHSKDQRVYTRSYNIATGVRGPLGDTGFDYNVYLNRSWSNAIRKSTDFLAANGVDDYYLGPRLGTNGGYPVFSPNLARLYQPLSRELYDQFSATNRAESESQTQNITALVTNTSLFELPAGAVGFAAIVQGQQEKFSNQSTMPGSENLFRGNGGSTTAAGSRDLAAAGVEFQVPILESFNANVSARYDKYSLEGGGGNGKLTWKTGLEFRPTDTLLLRGSYATAFRSPDLFYLYSRQSSGFSTATDQYLCRQAGFTSENFDDCAQGGQSIRAVSTGNTDLRDITANTFTYGVVWSTPDNALTASLDFNSVFIENEVAVLGSGDILETEANCRLGASESGTPFDINSPTCRDVLAQVTRLGPNDPVTPNGITEVATYPINLSKQRQNGLQAQVDYRWNGGNWGDFSTSIGHYRVLKHETKYQEGDPTYDQLCCNNSNELHYRTTASLSWSKGPMGATLWGINNAPTWRQDGEHRDIGPWTTFNGSFSYRFNEKMGVLFTMNNITNQMPPRDRTNGGWPFYDTGNYNVFGRSGTLEFQVDL